MAIRTRSDHADIPTAPLSGPLLTLDVSSTAAGWCVFSPSGEPTGFGVVRPRASMPAVDRSLGKPPLEGDVEPLPPVDYQEVWASGVTYERSRQARVEEAVVKSAYDLVFDAERPELFMKLAGWRVPPPGAPLRIRGDSTWDVPEPELALVLTAQGQIAGYLVAISVSDSPDSTIAVVGTFLPPLAPMIVPSRAAHGALPAGELVLSIVLLVAASALLLWVAARIYDRAVLRMGAPIKLVQALRLAR